MNVYQHLSSLPPFKDTLVTVGSFDGVHEGHKKLLNHLLDVAAEKQLTPVIISFDRHPKEVLSAKQILFGTTHLHLLNTLEEKIEHLRDLQIPHLVIVPFTKTFAKLSAEQYVSDFLVKNFSPKAILVGHDHHFGHARKGNIQLLESMAPSYGYEVIPIEAFLNEEIAISSTRIRALIQSGELKSANHLLGYPYSISGLVFEGDRIGRSIGFPTANMNISSPFKLFPPDGVYAVFVYLPSHSERKLGMMNIGCRPTVHGKDHRTEIHIFDFDENLYFTYIKVEIIERIRDEKFFEGLDALKQQLITDKLVALSILQSRS